MIAQRAGFWVRFVANLFDLLLVGVPLAVLTVTFFGICIEAALIVSFSLFIYVWLTPIYFSGCTLGKHLVGIRIYVRNGGSVTYFHMFMRVFISGLFYVITCGLGLIFTVLLLVKRQDKRTIHDRLANTYVAFEQ